MMQDKEMIAKGFVTTIVEVICEEDITLTEEKVDRLVAKCVKHTGLSERKVLEIFVDVLTDKVLDILGNDMMF